MPDAQKDGWDYADYLMKVIGEEIKNGDLRAVEAGIRVLATVDPSRAQNVLDAIEAGLTIRAYGSLGLALASWPPPVP